MKNKIVHILIIKLLAIEGLMAQPLNDSLSFDPVKSGAYPKKIESVMDNISISGYYRFLGCYTDMKDQYAEFGAVRKKVFLGDDSNIPQLMLNIGGRPTKNTSFSTDLFLWTPLSGSTTDYVKGLNLGVNLNGSHTTNYGTFSVKTGGIHWYTLSPFTFAANTGYNRYSLFERNPWDPTTALPMDRYRNFYNNGALSQDVRWGQQAFQGFILEGVRLPKGFSFAGMYGKSQFNGGALPKPNLFSGGKIRKDFNQSFISINAISSKTFKDSLTTLALGYHLLTTEFNWHKQYFNFLGEVGTGNYYSPTSNGEWGEALDLKLQTTKELTYFPVELRYYQISPKVINNNGVFWNSSIQEYNDAFATAETPGSQTLLIPFASSLVNIGQLTNNRRGAIINVDMVLTKKHKVTLGYSAAKEIVALSDRITYGHPANNLALSRFWRWAFPANVGPYGDLNKIYRGVYEMVQITDKISAKGFNSIEVSYKSDQRLFGKELMIFYLGGFHSVQRNYSNLPVFSEKAYLQSYNQQLEFYYLLFPKLIVSNYLGFDRIIANDHTQLDAITQLPKNQQGLSYAIGLDFQLAKNTGLYIRQRWMRYEDKHFAQDHYKGMETTVELKIFF